MYIHTRTHTHIYIYIYIYVIYAHLQPKQFLSKVSVLQDAGVIQRRWQGREGVQGASALSLFMSLCWRRLCRGYLKTTVITLPQAVIISPAGGDSHLKLSKTATIWNTILDLIPHGQRTDARREVPTFAPKRTLQHVRSSGTTFWTRSPLRAGRCRLCLSISSHHLESWQDSTNKPGDFPLAARCYWLFKQIVETRPPQILLDLFGQSQCHLPKGKWNLSVVFELHVFTRLEFEALHLYSSQSSLLCL